MNSMADLNIPAVKVFDDNNQLANMDEPYIEQQRIFESIEIKADESIAVGVSGPENVNEIPKTKFGAYFSKSKTEIGDHLKQYYRAAFKINKKNSDEQQNKPKQGKQLPGVKQVGQMEINYWEKIKNVFLRKQKSESKTEAGAEAEAEVDNSAIIDTNEEVRKFLVFQSNMNISSTSESNDFYENSVLVNASEESTPPKMRSLFTETNFEF